jgi:tryptophan synthase alpha chain
MNGIESLAATFGAAQASGRSAALMPYMMGGFPTPDISREIGLAYAESGADIVELGVPFSDPLADGPVIHAAASTALRAGAHLPAVLDTCKAIARRVPVVVMCYANLILAHGLDRFADALVDAGASGLIVPDLPLEESGPAFAACEARRLALVPLVAPTTPDGRLSRIGERARGYVYALSVTGTTGERATLDAGLATTISRVASHTAVPVAVGFGTSTPEQAAAAAAAGAKGVIVGSRLIRAAAESDDPVATVADLLGAFSGALRGAARRPDDPKVSAHLASEAPLG